MAFSSSPSDLTVAGNQPPKDRSLNDLPATDQTIIASDRTLPACVRTSLTLVIPGLTFLQPARSLALQITASVFVPAGVAVFITGVMHFRKKEKSYQSAEKINSGIAIIYFRNFQAAILFVST